MTNTNLKKLVGTIVGVGVGAIGIGIGYRQYKKTTIDQWLKKLVVEVWESEEVQASVRKLELNEKPTLVFEELEGNAVMCMRHQMFTEWFTIKKTVPEYTIYIDLKALYGQISSIQSMSINYGIQLEKSIIKMLLLHECRHIAQSQDNFFVGQSTLNFSFSHGEEPCEMDANKFAVSQAKDEKEKVLFEFMKTGQEYSPLSQPGIMRNTVRNVQKQYNPLAILFK